MDTTIHQSLPSLDSPSPAVPATTATPIPPPAPVQEQVIPMPIPTPIPTPTAPPPSPPTQSLPEKSPGDRETTPVPSPLEGKVTIVTNAPVRTTDVAASLPAGEEFNVPEIKALAMKLHQASIPDDLRTKAENQISRIALTLKYGGSMTQLDITAKYIDWITSLPWYTRSVDELDINEVKKSLDASHFGLEGLKKKILEYLSVIALQKKAFNTQAYHIQSPMFVGLAGTGKTTFAKALAVALKRKFVRIPFGGLSSARDLRGQSKTSPESEPGYVIKALREAGTKNPVILLDELDRTAPDARAEIMGVLLELLDPGQNVHYTDYFIDFPFNLNEVLFVATGNNTTNVAAAVLDRLEVIQMPSYTDEEKMAIGKNYVLPSMLKEVGLTSEQLSIDEALWPKMVRPLGFEPGIRSLERMVQNIVRRVAYKIVSGEGNSFHIDESNVKDYTNIIVGAQ
ncbi:MAG: AAA family ATPase [Patescibacteria group bacterium]|nr:AAA family ATPase [Patescibacteria group bacterium]